MAFQHRDKEENIDLDTDAEGMVELKECSSTLHSEVHSAPTGCVITPLVSFAATAQQWQALGLLRQPPACAASGNLFDPARAIPPFPPSSVSGCVPRLPNLATCPPGPLLLTQADMPPSQVDVSKFEADPEAVSAAFREAVETVGFVVVTGHGIPQEDVKACYDI
eukprot:gene2049-3035_t